MFVVVEGIDRSGKTTLVNTLAAFLRKRGTETEVVSYPNRGNTTGQIINEVLQGAISLQREAVHLLFSANRWEDNEHLRSLSREKLVLCDRYSISGISYSLSNNLSLSFSSSTEQGLLLPDLLVFLDIPPSVVSLREGFGNEVYENTPFQEKVYSHMKDVVFRHSKVPTLALKESSVEDHLQKIVDKLREMGALKEKEKDKENHQSVNN